MIPPRLLHKDVCSRAHAAVFGMNMDNKNSGVVGKWSLKAVGSQMNLIISCLAALGPSKSPIKTIISKILYTWVYRQTMENPTIQLTEENFVVCSGWA